MNRDRAVGKVDPDLAVLVADEEAVAAAADVAVVGRLAAGRAQASGITWRLAYRP